MGISFKTTIFLHKKITIPHSHPQPSKTSRWWVGDYIDFLLHLDEGKRGANKNPSFLEMGKWVGPLMTLKLHVLRRLGILLPFFLALKRSWKRLPSAFRTNYPSGCRMLCQMVVNQPIFPRFFNNINPNHENADDGFPWQHRACDVFAKRKETVVFKQVKQIGYIKKNKVKMGWVLEREGGAFWWQSWWVFWWVWQ